MNLLLLHRRPMPFCHLCPWPTTRPTRVQRSLAPESWPSRRTGARFDPSRIIRVGRLDAKGACEMYSDLQPSGSSPRVHRHSPIVLMQHPSVASPWTLHWLCSSTTTIRSNCGQVIQFPIEGT